MPPPVPSAPALSSAPPDNIAAYGAPYTPYMPSMINPQDAYADGVAIPTLPGAIGSAFTGGWGSQAFGAPPPVPMPGRPPALNVPTQPDFVQRMFLNTPIGKGLNALNGGKLGSYRVPRVSPQVHARLMAQQSPGSRGQDALRAAGMLDQFGMII